MLAARRFGWLRCRPSDPRVRLRPGKPVPFDPGHPVREALGQPLRQARLWLGNKPVGVRHFFQRPPNERRCLSGAEGSGIDLVETSIRTMRYLSVCSGIEAATVAWHPLGWTPVAFAEIEPFPSAVLAYRFPDVPNLGDMTLLRDRILTRELEAADLLVGGTPCQSFSIAGLRKSLSDERGNLTLEFVRLANAIDDIRRADGKPPAYILWENVPGVFSTSDNAFGAFLAGLVGSDTPHRQERAVL